MSGVFLSTTRPSSVISRPNSRMARREMTRARAMAWSECWRRYSSQWGRRRTQVMASERARGISLSIRSMGGVSARPTGNLVEDGERGHSGGAGVIEQEDREQASIRIRRGFAPWHWQQPRQRRLACPRTPFHRSIGRPSILLGKVFRKCQHDGAPGAILLEPMIPGERAIAEMLRHGLHPFG